MLEPFGQFGVGCSVVPCFTRHSETPVKARRHVAKRLFCIICHLAD